MSAGRATRQPVCRRSQGPLPCRRPAPVRAPADNPAQPCRLRPAMSRAAAARGPVFAGTTDCRLSFAGFGRPAAPRPAAARSPALLGPQAITVEIEIDDRRRVERQNLADEEP